MSRSRVVQNMERFCQFGVLSDILIESLAAGVSVGEPFIALCCGFFGDVYRDCKINSKSQQNILI